MATSKLNAEQFESMIANEPGVIFVYDGKEGKKTATHYFGEEFEATAKTQDEILRVMKSVYSVHWLAKEKETELRERNDGIRMKYRTSTPSEIIINSVQGKRVATFNTEYSDFSKFGLFPTKKDLERSVRDKKKYMHNGAVALLEALSFRIDFPKAEELSSQKSESETSTKAETKPAKEQKQSEKAPVAA